MNRPDEAAWEQWIRVTQGEITDPLRILRLVAMFQRYFDAVEAQAVTAATGAGRSWQEIFEVLGPRRQSVWENRRRTEETIRSRDWIQFGATGSGPV